MNLRLDASNWCAGNVWKSVTDIAMFVNVNDSFSAIWDTWQRKFEYCMSNLLEATMSLFDKLINVINVCWMWSFYDIVYTSYRIDFVLLWFIKRYNFKFATKAPSVFYACPPSLLSFSLYLPLHTRSWMLVKARWMFLGTATVRRTISGLDTIWSKVWSIHLKFQPSSSNNFILIYLTTHENVKYLL